MAGVVTVGPIISAKKPGSAESPSTLAIEYETLLLVYYDRGAQSACDMYSRLKPFRCQHRSNRGSTDSCDYLLTRGYPDQFLRSTQTSRRDDQTETVTTRLELITDLQQAHQSKVDSLKFSGDANNCHLGEATITPQKRPKCDNFGQFTS